jgi:hypothetical protein
MFRNGQRLNAVIRIERQGDEPRNRYIGSAFINVVKDGEKPYIKVTLDALPPNGRFSLFPDEPKENQEAQSKAA